MIASGRGGSAKLVWPNLVARWSRVALGSPEARAHLGGVETAGRGWTRAARTAARIGGSLARMGEVIERNGAILAKGRRRARHIGRNLVAFGGGSPNSGPG